MLLEKVREVAKSCNKEVESVEIVQAEGIDFKAFYDAQHILDKKNFVTAPMCREMPVGFSKDISYIAKWKNLTKEDKGKLNGVLMTDSDFRQGAVGIVYFK
jgi:hypothetical protein